jgi:hypothetical protein
MRACGATTEGGSPASVTDDDPAATDADVRDTAGVHTVAIEVEQGDSLGRSASVLASARRGPAGR